MTEQTIKIAHQYRATFGEKFARLVQRAARLGLAAPTLTWGDSEWVEKNDRRTLWHTAVVTGQPVIFDGWRIVAALDLLDGAVVVRSQETTRPEWRANASRCDHCRATRRRNLTVVVRHTTGTEKIVGTDCLRDFAPSDKRDPMALAAYWNDFLALASDTVGADDGEERGGGSGALVIEPRFYLPVVAEITLTKGFISKRRAEELGGTVQTTAAVAFDHAYGRDVPNRIIPGTEACALATAALEWAQTMTPTSDYEQNISALARAGYGEFKHMGYLASIIPAYQRAQAQQAEQERRRVQAAESRHIGTVGEKIEVRVTLRRVIALDSFYGTKFLHIFADEAGNVLKWFCSGAVPEFPAEGEFVAVKATITDHGTRNGVQETTLTRVRLATKKAA